MRIVALMHWGKTFLLTTTRVRQNLVLSANASIHDQAGGLPFGFLVRARGYKSAERMDQVRPTFTHSILADVRKR